MKLADIAWKTLAEGPGERTALWFQGCRLRCGGCCNPQMWTQEGGTEWDVEDICAQIKKQGCPSLVLLGGEPLDQTLELPTFLKTFRKQYGTSSNIWLFSGYTWEEIQKDPIKKQTCALCDMVIAGPYQAKAPPEFRKWIGSSNQTVHAMTPDARDYLPRWPQNEYSFELTVTENGIALNGWPI